MALAEIPSTGFCDKNTWSAGNDPTLGPSNINDNAPSTRWVSVNTDATLSLQNFGGVKFASPSAVKEIKINIASWGRNIRIGTWASGADPESIGFTKSNIIAIKTIDATTGKDDDAKTIAPNTELRFVLNATNVPGIVVYCDDNATSVLSNVAGQPNTQLSLNELHASVDPLGLEAEAPWITQVAELVLVKESVVSDLQVSNTYAAFIFDAPPLDIRTTQTAELILQKSAAAHTVVTQTAELILQKSAAAHTVVTQTAELVLQKSPPTSLQTTQVSELFLVSETSSVFWLNFGTLEAPERYKLYDSLVGRASSVPPACKIQVEGFFAPGTHLVINDVPSGTVATVKNNDRVYIHGGVTNYWQTNMPVYAYYEENGETARLLVGNWLITQPTLTPIVTQVYYGSKVKPTWMKLEANHSFYAALTAFATKAITTLVSLTTQAVQAIFGSLVSLIPEQTKAHAQYSAKMTWVPTIALVRLSEAAVNWDITKALAALSVTNAWEFSPAHINLLAENTVSWDLQKTHDVSFVHSGYIDTKALYGTVATIAEASFGVGTSYFASNGTLVLSANYAQFTLGTDHTKAAYGSYEQKDFIKVNVNYDNMDQVFDYAGSKHAALASVDYVSVPLSAEQHLFSMEPIGTIAYSVLADSAWERSTAQGTGSWQVPTDNGMHTQAKFGMVKFGEAHATAGHSEYSYRESMVIHGPQLGYVGMNYWLTKTHPELYSTEIGKTSTSSGKTNVTLIKTAANNGVYNLKPFLDMQSVNYIGPASLYKGFDTRVDIEEFTENFGGVHIAMKYNGYVYTLDVDKTFICEIFNNAPVKWLLQGG